MRHDLRSEGLAYRLRPIGDGDAALVIGLRCNPAVPNLLHEISDRVEDQLAWLQRYYERIGDYYFVIERRGSGIAEGVVALYDIDRESGSGEWGRWFLKPGSLAAVESAWLIYRTAFELLGLTKVYCRTTAANTTAVSFHESCGLAPGRLLPLHFRIRGHLLDAIEHRIDRADWPGLAARLQTLSERTARRIARA